MALFEKIMRQILEGNFLVGFIIMTDVPILISTKPSAARKR